MTIAWIVLLAAVLAAVVVWLVLGTHGLAMARWFMRAIFPEVPRTTPSELAAWLADASRPAPVLLDVRSPEEFAVSHLPGAVRCDCGAGAEAVLAALPKDRPVVVYCAAGYRSTKMARRLAQAGVKEIYDLEGGIFAWAKASGPLERDGQPVTAVHPFNAMGKRMLGGKSGMNYEG
ncbi:MAG: rhodanese-like domain-containing protein [Verrucomicrobia bacterium]|nr:rhodanese-like domain-containing protein [Verrucomicrobiota bacterium]